MLFGNGLNGLELWLAATGAAAHRRPHCSPREAAQLSCSLLNFPQKVVSLPGQWHSPSWSSMPLSQKWRQRVSTRGICPLECVSTGCEGGIIQREAKQLSRSLTTLSCRKWLVNPPRRPCAKSYVQSILACREVAEPFSSPSSPGKIFRGFKKSNSL